MSNMAHSPKEPLSRYELSYPIELAWKARIWTLKQGDTLERNGQQFVVSKVTRSPIPGEQPVILISPIPNVQKC
jgi:hypothetical protein